VSRQLRGKLLLGFFSLAFSLAIAELALRVVARTDADGNTLVLGRPLRPYVPPAEATRKLVAAYEADADRVLQYDPELGWAPRPGGLSRDGMYAYDARGARTGAQAGARTGAQAGARTGAQAPAPRAGRRVLLFGDSFTQGDDVRFEETWAFALQRGLDAAGQGAEVVNLGFAGYGMDQALLRWRKTGVSLGAEVVVFGFQAENVSRNLNLLRPLLWWGSGLPFSKPRFALEDGRLRLLNSPAIPPAEVPEVLAHLSEWPLARYEGSYHPEDYAPRWWSRSKLASLVADGLARRVLRDERPSLYALEGEPARLALAIVGELASEAEERGASFLIVHLPKREDLRRALAGEPLEYAELLAELARRHRVADPTPRLLARAAGGKLDELFAAPGLGHYSAAGNAEVGALLAEALIQGGVISVTSPVR
jgi:hypothetical protein